MPWPVTFFVLPSGPPIPTIAALMLIDPRLPRGDSFLHLRAPFLLGERVPGRHARAGLAAEKNREICLVCAHGDFLPLCLRVEAEARYSGAGDRRWRRRPWRPLGLGQNEGALQNGLGVRPSSGRSEATRGRDKRERFGLTPRHSANEAPRRELLLKFHGVRKPRNRQGHFNPSGQ